MIKIVAEHRLCPIVAVPLKESQVALFCGRTSMVFGKQREFSSRLFGTTDLLRHLPVS